MKRLLELCEKTAVSGFEYDLGVYVENYFSDFCDETEIDALGNVIGVINKGKSPKIMIEAHLDEIGMMVKDIDDNGFIRFVAIGGVDSSILPSCEVYIHGKEKLFGVIGAKPPHLQTKDEADKAYKIEDLFIDTGFSGQELKKYVRIGDVISFAAAPIMLKNEYFSSKSIDNRMGVFVVGECLKRLKAKNVNAEIVGLCAVQEEVGCRGAKVGAFKIEPDIAFVIDVTHGTSPYINEAEGFELGSGAAIGVGPNLHGKLTQMLISTANENNILNTIEVCAGNSGTDAWPIQISKSGVPTMLVSVPLRYMHTSVETINSKDIDAAINVICTMIERGEY